MGFCHCQNKIIYYIKISICLELIHIVSSPGNGQAKLGRLQNNNIRYTVNVLLLAMYSFNRLWLLISAKLSIQLNVQLQCIKV